MELFGEQLNIRNLLRAQSAYSGMNRTVVSTGIFIGFLFEPHWGVVEPEGEDVVVRALGSGESCYRVYSGGYRVDRSADRVCIGIRA